MDAQSIWLGAGWMVEIYCEHFADEHFAEVAEIAIFVITADEARGHKREVTALACPSPGQAREMAAALMRLADHAENPCKTP